MGNRDPYASTTRPSTGRIRGTRRDRYIPACHRQAMKTSAKSSALPFSRFADEFCATKVAFVSAEPVAQTKKYYAHDEENTSRAGDVVRIMETRPLSATKRWRLLDIVEKAK